MKRLLLTTLFATFALLTYAVEYDPILKPGRKWVTELVWPAKWGSDPITYHITYSVEPEEVVVEGKKCRILSNDVYENRSRILYEENGRLYYYEQKSEESGFIPIFDISLNVGDELDLYECSYTLSSKHISKIIDDDPTWIGWEDWIEVRGKKRRRLHLQSKSHNGNGNTYYSGTWIEGIGAATVEELTYVIMLASCSDCHYPTFRVLKCYDGDELVFSTEDYDSYAAIGRVELDSGNQSSEIIYNLMGLPVTNPRSGEIYIQGGNKILWP